MSGLAEKNILIVDDEAMLREVIRDVLEFEGAQVTEAENGVIAWEHAQKENFDFVISDIRMPGGDGVELLDRLRAQNSISPLVMLITGYADLSLELAFQKGAETVIPKPFDLPSLLERMMFLLKPFRERVLEKSKWTPKTKKSFSTISNWVYGRGGVFIPDWVTAHAGSIVEFEINDLSLGIKTKALGQVKWVRKSDQGSFKKGVGVEILSVDSSDADPFIQRFESNTGVPFIPWNG